MGLRLPRRLPVVSGDAIDTRSYGAGHSLAEISAGGHGELACFSAFAIWTLHQVFVHVPWGDELQALMIARESTGLLSLHRNLAYEGYPGLWHLVLFAVTRFRADPEVLPWVQAPVAAGLLAMIWFASPFGRIEKLLLSASYYLSFEYSVLARGYGLGVLLFFGVIALRRTPWAWLLLGLMANVSLHFLALGGIMGCLLLWRGSRSPTGIAACLALAGLAIATAWPAPDMIAPVPQGHPAFLRAARSLEQMSAALLPMSIAHGPEKYWDALFYEAGPIALLGLGVLVPVLAILSLRRFTSLALAMAAFCATALAIGTALFIGWNRHYGLIFILLICLHWIAREEGRGASSIWRGWLVVSATAGLWTAYWSTGVPFSASRAMAEWVRRHGIETQQWAAYPGTYGTNISAYLNIPTFNVEAGRWNTFIRWNYPGERHEAPDQVARRLRQVPARSFYLVSQPSWLPPAFIAGLEAQGIAMHKAAEFDAPGTIFPLVAYRVSVSAR